MKYFLFIVASVTIFSGCSTEQRDLYTASLPLLDIEGNWEPSLNQADMSMNATALVYSGDGVQLISKNYFSLPRNVTVPLTSGVYNILLFNGMMYSEQQTHISSVNFRATDRLSTFEAVVSEGIPNIRLDRSEGEYIASNDMEILTSALKEQEMTDDAAYYIKYKNGKNGGTISGNEYIVADIEMTPAAVSYECQVVVSLINQASAYVANGALKGFVGSVFMATRMPSHMDVTHQFRLNSLKISPEDSKKGTIQSPIFVTFGPPLDIPDRIYTLDLCIVLIDGSERNYTFDITDQITPVIEKIKSNLNASEPIDVNLIIPIEIMITLPEVESLGSIGVDEWGDDEIIKVPIK